MLLVSSVYFSCFTPDVGPGGTLFCVSFLNANASPIIACTIPYCVRLISISLYLKYSNYLSYAHAQFFSICRFTSWIWLIDSTSATFPFWVASTIFLWAVDVFPFTLVFPTWCQCCPVELFAPIFMVFVVPLCRKGMLGPSFLGIWNGCVIFVRFGCDGACLGSALRLEKVGWIVGLFHAKVGFSVHLGGE